MPDYDLDTKVKLAIYEITAETGRIPNSSAVSHKIDIDESEVVTAFGRLDAKRLLLPEPDDPSRIRMAPPFSGIPTAFPVEANGQKYFANCVWDAYGIAAALHCGESRFGWSHRRTVDARSEKRSAAFETVCCPFCGTGCALVGRHRFHMSNDVALTVG